MKIVRDIWIVAALLAGGCSGERPEVGDEVVGGGIGDRAGDAVQPGGSAESYWVRLQGMPLTDDERQALLVRHLMQANVAGADREKRRYWQANPPLPAAVQMTTGQRRQLQRLLGARDDIAPEVQATLFPFGEDMGLSAEKQARLAAWLRVNNMVTSDSRIDFLSAEELFEVKVRYSLAAAVMRSWQLDLNEHDFRLLYEAILGNGALAALITGRQGEPTIDPAIYDPLAIQAIGLIEFTKLISAFDPLFAVVAGIGTSYGLQQAVCEQEYERVVGAAAAQRADGDRPSIEFSKVFLESLGLEGRTALRSSMQQFQRRES